MLKVVAVAKGEVGYLEKRSNYNLDSYTENAGYNNYTKYNRDLDELGVYNGKKQGFDWCDIWVDWCFIVSYGLNIAMKMTFQPMGGAGAGCTYSMGYYRQHGRLFDYPEPGDQCFFSSDGWKTSYHTGLVVAVGDGIVYTIEGNTSSASGVIPNGGGVAEKSYPISWAKYGRPDYSLVPEYKPEEDEIMTGEEIFVKLNNYLQIKPAPDWAKKELDEAKAMGITDGTRPMELIPRYQAAIMAKRAVELARKG